MSSDVNMSLQDIIHKKKRNKRPAKKQNTAPARPLADARNKIILKRRTQIVDAREKLIQKARQNDARVKLQQLRSSKTGRRLPPRIIQENFGSWSRSPQKRERVFTDFSRQVSVKQHNPYVTNKSSNFDKKRIGKKGFLNRRQYESDSMEYDLPLKPLVRTINNDIMIVDDDEDDFLFEPRNTMSRDHRPPMSNLKIVTHNPNVQEKLIIRRAHEKERSPQRLPSILKKRPMAALRSERKLESPEKDTSGYRIIVSNLSNIVTSGDIQELFGGVGGLQESRLVRTGTAEVIYKKLEDAQKAVNLYHNRQLDGQPMNCLLVNPRPSGRGSSGIPASSSSNVEPDLSTFHKVLFSHF